MNWSTSVWFFDVDDTLINTAERINVSAKSVGPVLEKYIGHEKAVQIQQRFLEIFEMLMQGHKIHEPEEWAKIPDFKKVHDELLHRIEAVQKEIVDEFGTSKKWSREVFLTLAAEEANVKLSPEIISDAADAYWATLAKEATIHDGVLELFQEIQRHNRPIFLVTGSDAHLQLKENGQFAYVPEYSEEFKMRRITPLKERGITFQGVAIGDPVDKPHKPFFEKAVAMAEKTLGHPVSAENIIMIGDSYHADLKVPKEELGFGLVVLFEKDREKTEVIDERHIVTGNLAELSAFLEE